jgi:hypothetical protein
VFGALVEQDWRVSFGRKSRAIRKARVEIRRVVYSVQRQLRWGLETKKPPAMGAVTGAVFK